MSGIKARVIVPLLRSALRATRLMTSVVTSVGAWNVVRISSAPVRTKVIAQKTVLGSSKADTVSCHICS